jgi:hypothetical protein
VATIVDEHNCVGAPPVKRGFTTQQWWLQEILPTVITVTKTTTPKQIIDAMALHHQVAISYQAAKKVKSSVAAFKATYARVMPPVDITDLQPQEEFPCQPPRFRKPRGRPQTKRLTAGEMRARTATWRGALQDVPDRIQHCSRCK